MGTRYGSGLVFGVLCLAIVVQGCSDSGSSRSGAVAAPATAAAPPVSPVPAPPSTAPAPPMGEMRAMWVTRWYANTEQEVRDAVTLLKTHGMNTLVIQAYGNGMALYPSQVAPRSTLVVSGFDQLEIAIRLAHAEGIEVHAWLNVIKVWSGSSLPSDPNHVINQHPEWAMVDGSGRSSLDNIAPGGGTAFFCPERAGFVAYLRDLCRELAVRYPDLDGVHLDYIRYPGVDTCYCDAHKAAFRAAHGRDPTRGDPEFVRWKEDDITDLVSSIHDDLAGIQPDMLLTAAVFRRGGQVSQDTYEWLRRGKLDAVFPMIYTSSNSSFDDLSRDFREHSGGRLVVPGINAGSGQVGEQIRIARANGCQGWCIFASSTCGAAARAETLAETGGLAMQNARRPWKDGTPDTEAPLVHSFAQGQVTANAAVFTWSTDEASVGSVTLTDAAGAATVGASTSAGGFEHRAVVTGLTAGRDYSFEVVSTDLAGNTTPQVGRLTTATVTSGPIVLDETSTGFSTLGSWISGSSSGGNDGGYLYHGVSATETAGATWRPALAVAGPYEVSVWYVHGANRSAAARYEVTDAGGTQPVLVDQTQSGRQWRSLGVFRLDPLTAQVRLSNGSNSPGVVVADAVRFTPQ